MSATTTASLVGKWRKKVMWETPAALAIAVTGTVSNPCSANILREVRRSRSAVDVRELTEAMLVSHKMLVNNIRWPESSPPSGGPAV